MNGLLASASSRGKSRLPVFQRRPLLGSVSLASGGERVRLLDRLLVVVGLVRRVVAEEQRLEGLTLSGHDAIRLTTAGGVARTYETWSEGSLNHSRVALPAGGTSERVHSASGASNTTTLTEPLSGATSRTIIDWEPDPRFGADAQFAARVQRRRPSERTG